MKMRIIMFLTILTSLLACQVDTDSLRVKGNWKLSRSDMSPLNFYGVNFDIEQNAKLSFEENGIIQVESLLIDSIATIEYRIVKDTIIEYFSYYNEIKTDTTSIIYIGKKNDLKFGYRIKLLTLDSMILVSKFRKELLVLPEPNEFGTSPEFFEYYEILLTKEK
jgi:hypothetical protein